MGKVSRGPRRRRAVGGIVAVIAVVAAGAGGPAAAQLPSADAAAEAHWMLYSRGAGAGAPFAVVDLSRSRLWAYDGRSRLVGASPVRLLAPRAVAEGACTLQADGRCIEAPADFVAAMLRPLLAGVPPLVVVLGGGEALSPPCGLIAASTR
jgi:hypothetical protein